jgi:hypothetical protein
MEPARFKAGNSWCLLTNALITRLIKTVLKKHPRNG